MERIQGDLLREAYYGDGEQSIDIIVKQGWGPDFAAGNVVKYLRRQKSLELDLEKARWYFAMLQMLASNRRYAKDSIGRLRDEILTPEEFCLLIRQSMP